MVIPRSSNEKDNDALRKGRINKDTLKKKKTTKKLKTGFKREKN